MKVVNIQFEDKDYKIVEEAKKIHGGNWYHFILDLARFYKVAKEDKK
jgi:hypothetical protein